MSTEVKTIPEPNLTTLVISDLHLTEEHQVDSDYPLWKKYKTKEFFFDDLFANWLKFQTEHAEGPVELVLNGDIFDFDSVTEYPLKPSYKITHFEKTRTMFSQKEKSVFKINVVIRDHQTWFKAVKDFIAKGNRLVFVIGNHDLELHFLEVQKRLKKELCDDDAAESRLRFCEWFYISNKDTHIEHGNQYDPYCVCENPVFPLIKVHNDFRVRIPFGNMTARYMVNVMGFFNPHSEENYTLTFTQYLNFFFKFLIKKQPAIIWTWFYSSLVIAYRSVLYRLREPVVDPFSYEEKVENIALKSQASPRIVRELAALSVASAVSKPWKILQVLWIDRAFIFLVGVLFFVQLFLVIDQLVDIQFYWMLIPMLLLAPFFIFYSSTVVNGVKGTKDPGEQRLRWISLLTQTHRVVFGHTHAVRHEIIGSVEYLNPGSWSPTFEDIECERPL